MGRRSCSLVNAEIERALAAGAAVAYTQDWHPAHTPHFAQDGGIWPVHCVQDTWGAELHPALSVRGPIVRKGSHGEDGYSGFSMRNPAGGLPVPTELDDTLARGGARRLVVCGLATDYCVKATALDGVRLGYETAVLLDAVRAVDLEPGDGDRALDEMACRGSIGATAGGPRTRPVVHCASARSGRSRWPPVNMHLVDATYELFRAFYAPRPGAFDRDGRDVGAVVGLMYTLLTLLRDEGATHVGCATDHVIRSFRNDLYAGYKTEAGVPPELLAQFSLAERAMEALGLVVWSMVEFEADDALAQRGRPVGRGARRRARPHLHPGQGPRPVRPERAGRAARPAPRPHHRRSRREGALGRCPGLDSDYLALVGDSADGFPGSARLGREIGGRGPGPVRASRGDPRQRRGVARGRAIAGHAQRHSPGAMVGCAAVQTFGDSRRGCAAPQRDPDELRWRGAKRGAFMALCEELAQPRLATRPHLWQD